MTMLGVRAMPQDPVCHFKGRSVALQKTDSKTVLAMECFVPELSETRECKMF